MKSNYTKSYAWGATHPGDWSYDHAYGGYFRNIRTFGEIRRNENDNHEFRSQKRPYRDRSASRMLDAWNDYPYATRFGGKSWKMHTKHRKQWMVGTDKDPDAPTWTFTRYGRLYMPWKAPWR